MDYFMLIYFLSSVRVNKVVVIVVVVVASLLLRGKSSSGFKFISARKRLRDTALLKQLCPALTLSAWKAARNT